MDKSSHFCYRASSQPASNRMGLSPGVISALERVHLSLRKALSTRPYVRMSSLRGIAEELAADGLLVTLRSGLGVGIESPDYLSTLRHTFLICQEGSSGLCVIVDPFFRDQFKVAAMPLTSSYCVAVSNLPECFVGTIGTVNALVCLLTGTLFQESTALGIELPPWRSKQALVSKWLPRRFADTVFTPPSFVSLHPALRSSVHGAPLSTSPTSVQSWPSFSNRVDSESGSPSGSSSDACSSDATTIATGATATATTTPSHCCGAASDQRSPGRAPFEPYTVISGFSAMKSDGAAAPVIPSNTPRAADAVVPTRPAARSALTEQLTSASNFSRAVQAEAEVHWQRCFESLQASSAETPRQHEALRTCAGTDTATTGNSNSSSGYGADPSETHGCSVKAATASLTQIGSSGEIISKPLQHEDVLRSLVVSPVHRRTAGCAATLKQSGGSYACSLRLPATALKMLPRVYTVKLAAAGAC
ncbi:hypothetical protein Vretimale_9703 [Volvox reticuliferus]|uniref:Uncharacterized protein n=1 Tax=Volvox reticuliferus TaxID=1737510 RepID=A0A8J4CQV6_9CHLO|nr:hypothetical protein Vretifemale_13401 [Volvox reticuliferus]GIM05256.1 hypothetical protein Vretimale_9703 [Volvox reticuliferus]